MTRNETRSNTNREAQTREVEEEYVFEEPDALTYTRHGKSKI